MKTNNTPLLARMILLAGLACEERQKRTPTASSKHEAFKKECEFYDELNELVLMGEWDEIERKLNEGIDERIKQNEKVSFQL